MDASRILLIGLVATNKVRGRAGGLLGRKLTKLLALAKGHFETVKAAVVQIATPVLGPPVVRQLSAAADAPAFLAVCERFAVENCVEAGVESDEITDALWNSAVPPEVQVLLPMDDIVALLIDDDSGWWREDDNVTHLAEVVEGVLESDQSLRGDCVTALDPEAVFQDMIENGDEDVKTRFVRFAAGLRNGVKSSVVFDAKFLDAFTMEKLVHHADAEAVWDFCRDALRKAAESTTSEQAPPALVTCGVCGARAQHGAKHCPSCGQAFTASATASAG